MKLSQGSPCLTDLPGGAGHGSVIGMLTRLSLGGDRSVNPWPTHKKKMTGERDPQTKATTCSRPEQKETLEIPGQNNAGLGKTI